ncbi:hypothetical protein NMG60_11020313 [Bertholletia excelsa]
MEVQRRPPGCFFHYPEEGTEVLNDALFCNALELQRTVQSVKEEIGRKEDELAHIQDQLRKAIQERDAAKSECRGLMLEKLILQQQLADEPGPQPPLILPEPQVTEKLSLRKPLPEKGKLLQAVMEAGPLLQTLVLVGSLPEWQHPPPPNTAEIPPVVMASSREAKLLHQESYCPDIAPWTPSTGKSLARIN